MRIQTKVVWLWSCLSAFTFIHTAAAQDYSADPFSQPPADGGVAAADYSGGDSSLDGSLSDGYSGLDPTAYQGVAPDGTMDGGVPYVDPSVQGYPPPMIGGPPPGAGYYPQVSPYDTRIMDRTYRENGIWVNDSLYGDRKYLMSFEYLRTYFNRPGTDTVGARGIGVPPGLNGFQIVTTGVFANGQDLVSDGVLGKFIIQNADKSTFEASMWYTAEGNATYQPDGKGDPGDITTLRQRGILTYYDGTPSGRAVAFDTDFKLGYKEQAFGADLTWSTTPFFESDGFRIRGLFGGKYVKLREQFTIHGEDSGLAYAFDISGNPIPASVAPNPFGNPAFTTDIVSRTRSDIGGPELGVRYELGGKNFLLWGQSRFAVAANREDISLYGNQAGDGFQDGFPTPTPANPKPAYFQDHRNHTHISPIFSQDFYFKGKVFKHLPILNDLPLIGGADMLVGYNFLLIGNTARPSKIIDYRLNNPRIDLSHSRWLMQNVTFGLQWEY